MSEAADPVAGLAQRATEIAERAQQAREAMARVQPTVRSSDGAVTVQVSANGALNGITFGAAAAELELSELAAVIMRTVRVARVRAAQQAQDALIPLIGESSQAMRYLRAQLPALDEAESESAGPSRSAAVRPDYTAGEDDGDAADEPSYRRAGA